MLTSLSLILIFSILNETFESLPVKDPGEKTQTGGKNYQYHEHQTAQRHYRS